VSDREEQELLTSNLALIERAVAFASRRHRLSEDDADEFRSIVHVKLIENDYAILRAYEARSSFATYISVVVQRMALDFRVHHWGKWHSSAEAKRLGELAVDLEKLLHRDGRTLDDALPILAARHDGVTRASLAALAARLPARPPRHREVAMEDAEPVAAHSAAAVEARLVASDRERESRRVSALVSEIIGRLPDDDRLILQLRFQGGMTVAQIARMLGIEQKLLYRRIEKQMRDLKRELEAEGVSPRDVVDLIGGDDSLLQFDFGNGNRRPSIASDGTVAQTEASR